MGYFRQTTRLQLSNFVEWSTEILFFNFPYLAWMILKAYFNHQHHDEMNVKNVHVTEVIETRNAMFYREERLEVRSDQWYDWLIMNIFYIFVAKSRPKKLHAQFQSLVSFKNEHSQCKTQTVKINVYPISHHQFSNFPRHSPKTLPWLKVRLHCKTKRKLNFWVRWLKHVQVASRWN